jgi:probable rRNA maturation factor
MIKIEIFSEGVRLPYRNVGKKKISYIARTAAGLLKLENVQITVIITNDSYIKAINKQYRKKNSPTDVLSFSNRDRPFPPVSVACEEMGDIYISIERAASQAEEYRTAFIDEVRRLLVHGILHLAGYDHERSKEDEAAMARKEEELCGAIGV